MHTFTRTGLSAAAMLALGMSVGLQAQQTQTNELTFNRAYDDVEATSIFTQVAPTYQASSLRMDTFYTETFEDGFDGWTFTGTPDTADLWEYRTDPDLGAQNAGTYPAFTSPTVGDGFAYCDYRKYADAEGIPSDPNQYLRPVKGLRSPAIDLSALDPAQTYALNFFSYQPSLNRPMSRVVIRLPDDAASEVVIWNTAVAAATVAGAPRAFTLGAIPRQFNGASAVEFEFIYEGDFYGWAIDDLSITQLPSLNLSVTTFRGGYPSFRTPVSQVADQSLYFVADIQNDGGVAQDVQLNLQVTDAAGAVLFVDSLAYGSIGPDSLAENKAFPTGFPLPSTIGVYTVRFDVKSLSADNADEASPMDNSQSFTFSITDQTYTKGVQLRNAQTSGDSGDEFEVGAIYYTPNLEDWRITVDSIQTAFFPQGFSDDGAVTVLEYYMYGYRGDLNGDGIPQVGDDDDDDAEFVLLSTVEYEIPLNTPDAYVRPTIKISDDNEPVVIPNDQDFIGFALGVNYAITATPGSTPNRLFVGVDNQAPFGAYNLAADTLGVTEYFNHYAFQPNDPIAANQATYNGFTGSGLWINPLLRIEPISGAKNVLAASQLLVRPNPVSDNLELIFNEVAAGAAQVTVTNSVGQQVSNRSVNVSSSQTVNVATTALQNGMYFLEVTTVDGNRAVRSFVVKH